MTDIAETIITGFRRAGKPLHIRLPLDTIQRIDDVFVIMERPDAFRLLSRLAGCDNV